MDALIGYTGFVGSTLHEQLGDQALALYNSKNIDEIKGNSFNTIYCAAPRGVKYLANRDPYGDMIEINNLLNVLKTVKCKLFILISSQDCNTDLTSYEHSLGEPPTAYGRNRLYFEHEVSRLFDNARIMRIGSLFGKGLKKNVIFDLLNHNYLENITEDYTLQLYNMEHLLSDIQIMLNEGIRVWNRFSETVWLSDILVLFNNHSYGNNGHEYNYHINITGKINIDKCYNNRTDYGKLIPRKQALDELATFIKNYKK